MPYEDDYKMWLEKMLIESNPDWVCDGMCDVELTHEWCGKHCGEGSDYVTPKCLHMFYHHIARADRKTENSSEKPNNCEPKTGKMMTEEEFDSMLARVLIGKDEPQPNADQHVQRIEYVGNDEKSRCWTCKHFERMHETPISSDGSYYTYVVCTAKECKYEPKDEPQTERSENE